jgi:hypothetical protein
VTKAREKTSRPNLKQKRPPNFGGRFCLEENQRVLKLQLWNAVGFAKVFSPAPLTSLILPTGKISRWARENW